MKLFSYWRSSSAWRVRIVLHYKAVPFEYVAVNLAPDALQHKSSDFAEVNPMQQVPCLQWQQDSAVIDLAQSVAIVEFLEERFAQPPLLPASPLARAWTRQAVEIINSGTQPLQNLSVLNQLRFLGGEEAAKSWAQSAIARGLAAFADHVQRHGGLFSIGDSPTLADVYLVPQLYNARRFEVDLTPFAQLLQIEERASALEPFARAHPDKQPDAPAPAPGKAGG